MSIPRVVNHVLRSVWAIEPEKLQDIVALVVRHDAGVRLSQEQIRSVVMPAPDRPATAAGGAVGVLPLYGSIFPRANLITENSGGTSLARFASGFRQFMGDPTVKAIVIEADTPGGMVAGTPEMAAEIMAARGQKPIVAHVNTLMASGGYYIGSAADEVVVSPSGQVGSIGVYRPHVDESAALAAEGIKVTLVSAGDGKVDGNPFEPLSDDARARMQKSVNESYDMFVAAVAKGRGVSAETVRKDWKAHMYGAREAVALGMADRVGTLEETISRLSSGAGRRASMRAEAEVPVVTEPRPTPTVAVAADGEAEIRLRRARMTL